MHDQNDREENVTLRLKDREFRYLATVMSMYVDSGKAYVQVATGALLLPIVFLRNLLGLGERDPLGWIPGPMWISWVLLLLSIGAGLLYQVKAVGYLEDAMEGTDGDSEDVAENAVAPFLKRWRKKIPAEPGFVFDLMAVTFYLGMLFFVIGAVEVRHYHAWLPYILCPVLVVLTAGAYFVL